MRGLERSLVKSGLRHSLKMAASTRKSINQLNDWRSIRQSVSQSINQSTNQSINQTISQSISSITQFFSQWYCTFIIDNWLNWCIYVIIGWFSGAKKMKFVARRQCQVFTQEIIYYLLYTTLVKSINNSNKVESSIKAVYLKK